MNAIVVDGKKIYYQDLKRWKYRTTRPYAIQTELRPHRKIDYPSADPALTLDIDGILTIWHDYCWDGCSGPTIDRATNMRGGLIHDALYQLMRKGLISKTCKPYADDLLYRILREDGMWLVTAKAYWLAVKTFGDSACEIGPDPLDEEIEAP